MDSQSNQQWKRDAEDALRAAGIAYRPPSKDELRQLPEFNWDVRKFQDELVLALEGQPVEILHVVEVVEKKGFLSRETKPPHYRVKCLVTCPESVPSGRFDPEEPFSISHKLEDGRHWRADVGTHLEQAIAVHLNQDVSLQSQLAFSEHANVNAWLEAPAGRDYMAINTAKRYPHAQDIAEYIPL